MVFRGLARHAIGSRYCGYRCDWSGDKSCSFGESNMVVECRWRSGCMYSPFRLRRRLITLPGVPQLSLEAWSTFTTRRRVGMISLPVVRSAQQLSPRYTGKERDQESGLDYFGARYLSSNMGRWLSPHYSMNSVILELPQSWNKDTSIATVDYSGSHTGMGAGSTSSLTNGKLAQQGARTCPLFPESPLRSETWAPHVEERI